MPRRPPTGRRTADAVGRLARALSAAVVLALIIFQSVNPAMAAASAPPTTTTRGPATAMVRLPFPQDDGSLTPYSFHLGYSLMTLVYDTLLWRDAGGVPGPWLASSVDTSSNGLRLTVHLVAGVKWQDGVALTAWDVAFTFGYVAAHYQARFTPEVADVARAVASNPTTVVIDLRKPSPGFAQTTLDDLPILPEHLWAHLAPGKLTPAGLPVGSGPYRLVAYQPGKAYRFQANLDYFRGAPAVATIEVPIIHTLAATLTALEKRQVDMVPLSLPVADASQVAGLTTRLATGPLYYGTALDLNIRQAPFDNLVVRRAVSEAIDLGQMVGVVGDSMQASSGFIYPGSTWASSAVLQTSDPVAARAVLGPLHLSAISVLAPDNDPIQMEAAAQVAFALQRVGVSAEPKYVSVTRLDDAMGAGGHKATFQMAIAPIDPMASYDPSALAGELADTGYHSAAFDALATKVSTDTNPTARHEEVDAELALLASDVPAVPLFFANGAFAYHPAAYRGWVYVKGTGILDKLSFLFPSSPAPKPGPSVVAATAPQQGGFDLAIVAWALVGVAGVLVVLLTVGLAFGRRQ